MASAGDSASLALAPAFAITSLSVRVGRNCRLEPVSRYTWQPKHAHADLPRYVFAGSLLAVVGLGCKRYTNKRRRAMTTGATSRGAEGRTMTRAHAEKVSLPVDDNRTLHARAIARRSLLAAPVAAASQSLWIPPALAERLSTLTPETLMRASGKVVVITGATAGVGLEAARTLLAAGSDVYVTGRTLEKATAAVADITKASVAGAGRAIPMELNLASLASVRRFASQWSEVVKRPIDILACNAGLALGQDLKEPTLTEDGFELTVGTNHLGHFLLVSLLEKQLSPTARIVVTASSVHNPATGDPGAQATLGNLSGLTPDFGRGGVAMVDGGKFDAAKAYKDSKLCNVLFTLELARRLQKQGSQITVNALSPGLIPSPTFFRYQSQGFSSVFAFAAQNLLKIAETPEFGGDTLVFMALDSRLDGKSGLFYSAVPPGKHTFVENTPSVEAQDESEAAELWRRSAALVGI